jgi:hypothetical protein
MKQMTQGKIEEPRIKRKVQLASKTELKKWADIGPRSVAAAARYRKAPERKQQE